MFLRTSTDLNSQRLDYRIQMQLRKRIFPTKNMEHDVLSVPKLSLRLLENRRVMSHNPGQT